MPVIHYSSGLRRDGSPIIPCAVQHGAERRISTTDLERVTCQRCLRSLLWQVWGERPLVGGLGSDE